MRILTLLLVLFLALAGGTAITKSPWSDEAWFASPALNLATKGFMGTTVLEPAGAWLKAGRELCLDRIDRHTYWVMPLHLLAQAAVYKIAGFSLFRMRALSIGWALVALAAWFAIVRSLGGNPLLTVALLALDHIFVWVAADGRMDMMSAALGFAGIALYLNLRGRNLCGALLAGFSLAAAAVFTNPNGILASASILALALYFDRSRVKFVHLLVALAPYAVFTACWTAYALEDRSAFLCQFLGNASGREVGLLAPLAALKRELVERYFAAYGLDASSSGFSRARLVIMVAWVASLAGVALNRNLRRLPIAGVLLLLLAVDFTVLTLFEGFKTSYYLVHIIPIYTALLALWIGSLKRRRQVAGVCALLAVQTATICHRVFILDPYHKRLLPMISVLKQHPATLIMGNAELAFDMGFDHVLDDVRLGYGSGKIPDIIVADERYESSFQAFRVYRPEIYRHIQTVLGGFRPIYHDGLFTIYQRRSTIF